MAAGLREAGRVREGWGRPLRGRGGLRLPQDGSGALLAGNSGRARMGKGSKPKGAGARSCCSSGSAGARLGAVLGWSFGVPGVVPGDPSSTQPPKQPRL